MTTETVPVATNPLDAVKHAAGSDIGLRREENQDSFGIIETPGFKLLIVADGMGGVKGGGIASNLAVNVLKECLEDKVDLNVAAITAAVEHANTEIFEKGTGDPGLAGMGTTYVGLGFVGSKMLISSVGDSRAYRIRDNNIQQLTVDHTLVMELLRSGAISPEQADNHPVSHMLTRSLGPAPTVEVDCWVCADGPARGDIYVMCSDGLYNLVHDHEIAQTVQDNYIDVAVQKLIKLANERGGTDNITVIAVEIGEQYPVGPEAFEAPPAAQKGAAAQSNGVEHNDSNLVDDSDVEAVPLSNGKHEEAAEEPEAKEAPAAKPKAPPTQSPRIESKVELSTKIDSVGVQAAEQEQTTATSQERHFSRTWLLGGAFMLTLVSFVGGFFAPRMFSGSNEPTPAGEEVIAPVQQQAQIARLEAEVSVSRGQHPSLGPALRAGFSDLGRSGSAGSISSDHDNSHDTPGIADDLLRIGKRKQSLRDLLADLEEKIGAFEKPLNARVVDQLREARQKREQFESEEDELRSQIDVATRRLAVWYGRRKRLQTSDPINLATEVAVASPTVKEKKEVFELATWSYLKEAEVLRYNPADSAQEKKVFDLAKVRKDRQRELGDEVRRAIDNEVSDSDRAIAELTLNRDKLLVEIENIRRNEDYAKVLMGSDAKAKELKRKELAREHDVAAAELEELNHMSPDPAPVAIEPDAVQPPAPDTVPSDTLEQQ
jgi:protein phosphatase